MQGENKPNQLFANRYRLMRQIGSGGFSTVWLASDQMAGDLEIALKIYAPGQGLDDQAIQIFREEYKVVFYLNHPNLLKPSHFDVFEGRPFLVLPFCSEGSVMKRTGQLDEETIARLLLQIGGALDYLHNQNPPVIHRDIKPENILADSRGDFYLTDFGISGKLRRTLTKSMGRSQESSGTTAFMAPELFQAKRQVIPESDIFAFGTMLYELITDELPFGQIGGAMLMNGAQVPDISDQCPQVLADLIATCLNMNPSERPTAKALMETGSHYLKNGFWKLTTHDESKAQSRQTTRIPNTEQDNRPPEKKAESPKPPKSPKSNRKNIRIAVASVLIIALIGIIWNRNVTYNKYCEWYEAGRNYYSLAQYGDALYAFEKALNYRDADTTHTLHYGLSHFKSGLDNYYAAQYKSAFEYFDFACGYGIPDAFYYKGELYFNGLGTPKSYKLGIEATRYAYESGFKMAAWRLGDCYAKGHGVNTDKTQADKYFLECIEPMRVLAEAGDPEAQGNLGAMYSAGTGVNQNRELAVEWYQKAADQGYVFIQHNLALCYYYGNGVEENNDEALKYFNIAALAGHPPSQQMLGRFYLNGFIVEKDTEEGLTWMRKAAEQNYSAALNSLGVVYYEGKHVKEDKKAAAGYFSRAVEYDSTDATAMNNLAYLYKKGEGVDQNHKKSIELYLYALTVDSANAASNYYNIGTMYADGGYGISQDRKKAKSFLTKAKAKGHEWAGVYMILNDL